MFLLFSFFEFHSCSFLVLNRFSLFLFLFLFLFNSSSCSYSYFGSCSYFYLFSSYDSYSQSSNLSLFLVFVLVRVRVRVRVLIFNIFPFLFFFVFFITRKFFLFFFSKDLEEEATEDESFIDQDSQTPLRTVRSSDVSKYVTREYKTKDGLKVTICLVAIDY